jgi:hypothetical protein
MNRYAATVVSTVMAGVALAGCSDPAEPIDETPADVQEVSAVDPEALAVAVLRNEEILESLRVPLGTLAAAARSGQVPDDKTRSLFATTVEVLDLAAAAEDVTTVVLDLGIASRTWAAAETTSSVSREDLTLWSPLLSRIERFEHFRIYGIRGELSPDDDTLFVAQCGFAGLGVGRSGDHLGIKGSATLSWSRADVGDGADPSWNIVSIRTQGAELTVAPGPLFADTTKDALSTTELARASESKRDDDLVAFVESVRGDRQKLDETVTSILDTIADGTNHFHASHIAVIDIDRDGHDDIYAMPSDAMPMLFRSRGDGTFEEVAEDVGLALELVHGAVFADFDNDGDSDAFLSFFERGTHYYRNDGGKFTQHDELIEGELPSWVLAFNAVDYDGDGLLDLYMCRYNGGHLPSMAAERERLRERGEPADGPFPGMGAEESKELVERLFDSASDPVTSSPGPRNQLYRNLGDGRFARVEGVEALEVGFQSMASSWTDYDGDGDPDVYVVNEAGPNQLIRNDGDGKFTDVTDEATSDIGYGMGAAWGDYDNDGREDLYVTNMFSKAGVRITDQMRSSGRVAKAANGNSLLRNTPGGFDLVSGRGADDIHVEAADFGWGGAFADLNNDGSLDLYVPAGFVTMPERAAAPGDC